MRTEGEPKHVHWALFNTCLHFFHNSESLRLVSQSFAWPNIDLAEQKFSIHSPSLPALDQLKSCGIIRRLRTQRLLLEGITRSRLPERKLFKSNGTKQVGWRRRNGSVQMLGERMGRRLIHLQISRLETGSDIAFSGREASNCSEEKRLNIMARILLPPT